MKINLKIQNRFTKRVSKFPLLVMLMLIIVSCSSDDDAGDGVNESAICGIAQLDKAINTGTLVAVDGELPWYGTFVNSQNYSAITGGTFIIRDDGTWESSLDNEVAVNGNITNNSIERSGTYECSGNTLEMINDQNQSAGRLIRDGENLNLVDGIATITFSF